ncbi:MAG: terpene cyclase/mutase family protein [Thermoplasmata archaeon]|nr:terpene cyclase/mutase family protein [Thermoplasmata archaeon]
MAARRAIPRGAWVRRILAKQSRGGHWESPEDLYRPKYQATIWNVQVLALLGVTRNEPRMAAACELFLDQFARADGGFDNAPEPDVPSELCVTGNLTRTLLLAGYGDDRRVRAAVDWIVRTQLADGGWHCWPNRAFQRGTLDAWEGLSALATLPPARRSAEVQRAVARGAEFFLRHRLMEQGRTNYAPWRRFHFPNHYYYDALVGLDLVTGLGFGADARLDPALALLAHKRRSDGRWVIDRSNPDIGPGAGYTLRKMPTPMVVEPTGRPSEWLTLTALRVRRRVAAARGLATP